jgi:hypothetical protein
MAQTNKKVNFAYFDHKADFTSALQTSLANYVVYIADTKEIFTHGVFFGMNDGAFALAYDSATSKILLKYNDVSIADLDATPFIKDGMIDAVTLHTTAEQGISVQTPYLKFVFNTTKTTASGSATASHEEIRVSVKDLVDIYNGANLYLSNSYAEASTYSKPAVGDSVDEAVSKLTKGIDILQNQLYWNEY